jgi:hypothetical protein
MQKKLKNPLKRLALSEFKGYRIMDEATGYTII